MKLQVFCSIFTQNCKQQGSVFIQNALLEGVCQSVKMPKSNSIMPIITISSIFAVYSAEVCVPVVVTVAPWHHFGERCEEVEQRVGDDHIVVDAYVH